VGFAVRLPAAALALLTPRWITRSVRNKLLAMALLPLLVVLPLLVGASSRARLA
jgi:hypothetical protein